MIRFLLAAIPSVGLVLAMFALAGFPLTQEKIHEIRSSSKRRRGKVVNNFQRTLETESRRLQNRRPDLSDWNAGRRPSLRGHGPPTSGRPYENRMRSFSRPRGPVRPRGSAGLARAARLQLNLDLRHLPPR